jgi:hypothetical protein
VAGGISDAPLCLPAPRGIVPLRVGGGARRLAIVRPDEVPVLLRAAGGVQRLVLDDQRYGAIGGEVRVETTCARDTGDRYEIEIAGGASHLTIAGSKPR